MNAASNKNIHAPIQNNHSLGTEVARESTDRNALPPNAPGADIYIAHSKEKTSKTQPPSVPGYRLLKELGEGGMGKVWLAEQESLAGRQVAVKLIRRENPSSEFIRRFIREGKSMALLNHPNIARILDAGFTDERCPYIVMELVHGQPLVTYCDEKRLSIQDRLKLFQKICDGVQHAHSRGLIHRDLKPSNVLITEIDEVAVPKIIDFGLAKTLESSTEFELHSEKTQFGQVLGSYLYMSPEQASAGDLDVDIRSDVFSLGAILHELLVGTTPIARSEIEGLSLLAIPSLIQKFEAKTPSTRLSDSDPTFLDKLQRRNTPASELRSSLEGGMDWVVMKSIENEAAHRYATVNAFSTDIQRFLNDEPVEAVPPSTLYRLKKFIRRNRVLAASTFAISFSIFAGFVGTSVFAFVANQAKKEAVQRGSELDDLLAKRNTKLANVLIDENRSPESHRYLEQIPASSRALEFKLLQQRSLGGLLTYYPPSLFEAIELASTGSSPWAIGSDHQSLTMIRYGEALQVVNQPLDDQESTLLYQVPNSVRDVGAAALNHDGQLFAFSPTDDQIKVVNLKEDKSILDLSKTGNPEDLIFTRNSRYLAWKSQGARPQFTVVDLRTGALVFELTDETDPPLQELYIAPTKGDDTEEIPPAPGEEIPPAPVVLGNESGSLIPLAPSPAEEAPAIPTESELDIEEDDFDVQFNKLQDAAGNVSAEGLGGVMEEAFDGIDDALNGPLGKGLGGVFEGMFDAMGDMFENLYTAFDMDGEPLPKLIAVADNGDHALLAALTTASTVQVWETQKRSLVFESPVFESMVNAIELSPDTKQLFVSLSNSTVHVISLEDNSDYQVLRIPNHTPCSTLEFSDDSSYCLLGSFGGNLYRYNRRDRAITETFSGHHRAISMIRVVEGDRLAVSQSVDGVIKFWELAPQAKGLAVSADRFSDPVVTSTVSFSGDGRFLAIGSRSNGANVYAADDYSSPKTFFVGNLPITHVKLNGDGSLLAASFKDDTCILVHTQTGEILFEYTGPPSDPDTSYVDPYTPKSIQSLDFSENGKSLLIAAESEIAVIDIIKKEARWRKAGSWFSGTFDRSGNFIYGQKLNENFRSLLVQLDSRDGSEKQILEISRNHLGGAVCMGGPNELYILQQRMREASTVDTIRGFDLRTMAETSTIPTGLQMDALQCTSDGSRILTRDLGGKINLWDPKSGEEVFSMSLDKTITGMALNRDMNRLVIAFDDGYWTEYMIDAVPQRTKIFTNTDTERFLDVSTRWDAFYTQTESGFNARSISKGSILKTWKSPETQSERTKAHLLQSETKTYVIFDDLDQGTFSLWDFESNKLLGDFTYDVPTDESAHSIEFVFDEPSMSLIRCGITSVELWNLRTKTRDIFMDDRILNFDSPLFAQRIAYVRGVRSDPTGKIVSDWYQLPSGDLAKESVAWAYPIPITTSPDGTQSLALEGDNLILVDRKYFEKPIGKLRLMRMKYLLNPPPLHRAAPAEPQTNSA